MIKLMSKMLNTKVYRLLRNRHGELIVFTENDMLTLDRQTSKLLLDVWLKKPNPKKNN